MKLKLITNEIFTAYLNCHHKGQLSMEGMCGVQHDYARMMEDRQTQYQTRTNKALFTQTIQSSTYSSIDKNVMQLGKTTISGGDLQHNGLAFRVDGLKRVSGKSLLGAFHYTPIIFHHEDKLQQQQKLLLAYGAFVLGLIQGRYPSVGTIIYGYRMTSMTIRLTQLNQQVESIIDSLEQIKEGEYTTRLRLNKHCEQCEFHELCRTKAVEKDDLSMLSRISEKEIKNLESKGIFTVNQLSYTYRYRQRPKRLKDRPLPYSHALQSLAIRENRVYVVRNPDIPKKGTRLFIDMEGDSNAKSVYLIGVLVEDIQGFTSHAFWAESNDDELIIFDKLFNLISRCTRPLHILHYGSYETKAFKRLLSHPKIKRKYRKLLNSDNVTNILSLIFRNIYFPTYSNRLKDIGQFLGFSWSPHNASGLYSIVWRYQWQQTHDDRLKHRLIRYNHDDCAALKRVFDYISSIGEQTEQTALTKGSSVLVDSLRDKDDLNRWGHTDFAIPEFSKVVEYAYFDYQQSKVYIRTSDNVRKTQRHKRSRQQHDRHRVPNKTVWLMANKCPRCKSNQISRSRDWYKREHSKLHLDLRITSSGIKRWVIRYRTQFHRCDKCGKNFVAPSYASQKKFGHALISWALYQHVVHRIPLNQVRIMIQENFDIRLQYKDIHSFKAIAVSYYKRTYNQLIRNLISGRLIHADETSMKITKNHGYVWAFASIQDVIYMFKETRKGAFLKDLLAGFSGVLVSDFYSVYDSLPCPQQKCLIHLMWDINRDLRKNPFDIDLKFIAVLFGELLREIVATIDRFGLKTRFLKKHKVSVKRFFKRTGKRKMSTEISSHYQDRFLKYEGKLFTFLDFDGIPWNNNNAEHAVKMVAKFRRASTKNTMEISGLEDYLVLLSLYATCEYRGISFLKFLVSRERDIDKYCESVY